MSKNFIQVARWIDPRGLLNALARHPTLWDLDTRRQETAGSPHAQAQAIHIRCPLDESISGVFDDLESRWQESTVHALPEAADVVSEIVDVIGDVDNLGRIMITKLPTGGSIDEHIDEGRYADKFDRFHLCLAAVDGSVFGCGDEAAQMAPGQLWWFNRKKPHSVHNAGGVARVHLIIDVESPRYRQERGITFQAEGPGRSMEEAMPLLIAHYHEIALYKDIPLAPDFETYRLLEAAGQLRVYSARNNAELIGYMVAIVRPHPHYKTSLTAMTDLLFVVQEERRGRVGVDLIRFAEGRLKAEGVQVIIQHVKDYADFGPLLERGGYRKFETLYSKRLDVE